MVTRKVRVDYLVHVPVLVSWLAFKPHLLLVCDLLCWLPNDIHCHHTHLQRCCHCATAAAMCTHWHTHTHTDTHLIKGVEVVDVVLVEAYFDELASHIQRNGLELPRLHTTDGLVSHTVEGHPLHLH